MPDMDYNDMDEQDEKRRAALTEMVRLDEEMGLYDNTDYEDCWVGENPDIFMNSCFCGVYPSKDYPNGACHLHGTCAGGPSCGGSCL